MTAGVQPQWLERSATPAGRLEASGTETCAYRGLQSVRLTLACSLTLQL